MVTREEIYAALTAEDNYAKAWSKGKESAVPGVEPHMVSRRNGQPFTEMEWLTFAELYLNEAKQGYANYVPDIRAVHIRLLKAANLLISALQVNVKDIDALNSMAGKSRTDFPVLRGGLKEFKEIDKASEV